jgi:hypothetical protein
MDNAKFERFCLEYRPLLEFIFQRIKNRYTGSIVITFKRGEIETLNAQECFTVKQLRERFEKGRR